MELIDNINQLLGDDYKKQFHRKEALNAELRSLQKSVNQLAS